MKGLLWRQGLHSFLLLVFSLFPHLSLADEGLLLAVHPYRSSSELIKAFSPLADYLSKELDMHVRLEVSPDYAIHIDRLGKGQVDIAYLGPASYVLMIEKYGLKPILARQVINGKPLFQGKIIKRTDQPIASLEELVGKRFAFGDASSTMSHLVPRYMLIKAGVDVDKLAAHQFLGSHDNVVMGVLAGDFDAGAVKEEVFYKYQAKGLQALATTPEIPEHLFVARSDLPEQTLVSLRQALLHLGETQQGQQILKSIKKGITGLQPAEDADYDGLREILAVLAAQGVAP